MEKLTLKKTNIINLTILVTLFCTYIFPIGLVDSSIPIEKLIFTLVVSGLLIFFNKKFTIKELAFIVLIIVLTVLSKSINYLLFLPIVFLDKFIINEKQIDYYLKKSNILYVCLFFTMIYSLVFFGEGGRYAHSAILEINQSGLAIFCLAILLMKKNKTVGYLTIIFGLLTFSRSYYLAVILYFFSKINVGKKISNSKILLHFSSYTFITLISTILLYLIGVYFIEQYKSGNVFWGDELSTRLFNFLDYSNLFRFMANVAVLSIFYIYPQKILFGITNIEYINYGNKIYSNYGVVYKYTNPHNLFLSHLKLYGFFAIIEIVYVSSILKKITNKNNVLVLYGIILYSLLLGAGLYSYWLYLSVFVLISLKQGDEV